MEDQNTNTVKDTFDTGAFLAQFDGKISEARREIAAKLAAKPWFQASDPAIQSELITLPQEGAENHDGYLSDMAARPDHIGGVDVLKIHSLARGKFALITIFDVKNTESGHEYTYEYVSWRYGSLPGAKGLVFVRPSSGEAPTHFIVLVGEKFAPATKVYDSIGGFIDLGVEGVQTLLDRILLEIKQEVGLEDLEVDAVINLGQVYTDPGMTNSKPASFVAFINDKQASRIPADPVNGDVAELKAGALIAPMSSLRDMVRENTDALFCTALIKAVASHETDAIFRRSVLEALAKED